MREKWMEPINGAKCPAALSTDAGCKVMWARYATKEDATLAAKFAVRAAAERAGLGYDFGWQMPGEVVYISARGNGEWKVTWPLVGVPTGKKKPAKKVPPARPGDGVVDATCRELSSRFRF